MTLDLFTPGAYFRRPGGNVERPFDHQLAVEWVSWNIGDDPGVGGDPVAWKRCRELWAQFAISDFPWLHCHTLADIDRLIDVGLANASPAIGANLEDVFSDFTQKGIPLSMVWENLSRWPRPIHIATLPVVQEVPGWEHFDDRCVFALEIFPDENDESTRPAQCIELAFRRLGKDAKVTLMLKTKAPNTRESYGEFFELCHSLYTGDDIEPSASGWMGWKLDVPCVRPTPPGGPVVPPKPPLTVKKFPYTGPCYGPGHPEGPTLNRKTVKALKRAQIRLGNLNQDLATVTDDYGQAIEDAMRSWQRTVDLEDTGQYGRGSWLELREAIVPAEFPHAGEYAMDPAALALVRADALTMVYPHPLGASSSICQGLHQTAGLLGNWAIDFCAPGGTNVLAVETATIRKLSGRDPAAGANQSIGIFGWSIHYETADGYRYFSTHYGARALLHIGQVVEVGQVLGTVGHWPGDPPRSHTHLGVTSPLGIADAKKRITAVSRATRVP